MPNGHWHQTSRLEIWVFIKAAHFHTTWPLKKLSEKNLGPYEIIAQVRKASFTLWLPNHLHTVHPIFHISQLEPATPNTILNRVQSLPLPIKVDEDIEYEILEILDSKLDKQRKCQLLYLIQWTGYEGTDQETGWLPTTELKHAIELIQDFHKSYPNKPGPLNSLWKWKQDSFLLQLYYLRTLLQSVLCPYVSFSSLFLSLIFWFSVLSHSSLKPCLRASGFGLKRGILLYAGISY